MKTSSALSDLTPFVYGATGLGEASLPVEERVQIARAAMQSGVWFHVSHEYGDALSVLRAAFDGAPRPKMIYKVEWNTVPHIRALIEQQLVALGQERMEVAQLCLRATERSDFALDGPLCRELRAIRGEGMVGGYVMEVFPWTSTQVLAALDSGFADQLVDGFIFYLNPLQRFASNTVWDRLHRERRALVAMRTVCGGHVHRLRDVPGAAWKPYIQARAEVFAPLFDRSRVESWSEFCVRFAHSVPGVRATVGSTTNATHLDELVRAAAGVDPLPPDIMEEAERLHRHWAEHEDAHAQAWTM